MVNIVRAPGVRLNAVAKSAPTSSASVVLSYTAPANKRATVTAYFNNQVAGTVAVSEEIVVAGNAFRPNGTRAAGVQASVPNCEHQLAPGDTFRFVVTTPTAITTADFFISVLEEL